MIGSLTRNAVLQPSTGLFLVETRCSGARIRKKGVAKRCSINQCDSSCGLMHSGFDEAMRTGWWLSSRSGYMVCREMRSDSERT